MTAPFTQDLISAYLDGELTPKERAVVEQQLHDHAELRKMHDELRALGETLRGMPTVGPREGFAQRVLRAAERRMLTGETPVGNPPVVPHGVSASVAASRRRAWPRNWRVVAGVLAMAASLMLVATWVFQPPGREVAQVPHKERRPDSMERAEQAADSSAPRGGAVPDEGVAALGALGDEGPTDTDPVAPRADGMGMGGCASKRSGGMGMSGGQESMSGRAGMPGVTGGMASRARGAQAESSTAPGDLEWGGPMRGGASPTPQTDLNRQTDLKTDFACSGSPEDVVKDRVEERVEQLSETPPIRQLQEQLSQRQTLLLEVRWKEPNIDRLSAPPAAAPFLPVQDAESARARVSGLRFFDEPRSRRVPSPTPGVRRLDRENGEPMPGLIVVDATEEEIHAALAHLSEQAVLIPVDAEAELDVLRHFAVPPIPTAAASDSPTDGGQRVETSPRESAGGPLQSIVGTLMEEANVSRDRFGVAELAAEALDSRTGKPHDGEGSEYIMFRLIRPLPNPSSLPEANKQE